MKTNLQFLQKFILVTLFSLASVFGWGQTVDNSASGTSIPTGWSSVNTVTTQPIQMTGYYLVESTTTPTYDYLYSNSYTTLSGSNVTIAFDIATYGSGTNSPLKVDMSIDDGSTWTGGTQTSGSIPTSSTFVSTSVVFNNVTSNNVKFRFYDGINGDKSVRLKNIVISKVVNCTAPTINTQPSSTTVYAPSTANFTVAATGTSLTYQWQYNDNLNGWQNVSTGGTSASYTTAATTTAMSGYQFRAIVYSGTCSTTSNPATLTVNPVVVPTVSTTTATSITTTAASSGGNITNDGGASVTARGVAFGTSANPTSGTNDGSGTGTFASSLSGLSVNTQYFYRAYATNSAGTGYGAESSFYTLANVPSTPIVSNPSASTVDVALGSGDGNPSTTLYAFFETSTSKYVQTDGTLGASPVWQTLSTWGTKTITGLSSATTYTFEVKAQNGASVETAYSTTASSTTLANVTASYANVQSVTSSNYDEGSVNPNTVYAQVYASGITEAGGQGAGVLGWVGYSTSNTDPSSGTGWTWIPASFNVQSGNNDEFKADLPNFTPGTYYIASRFNINGGSYSYGGGIGNWSNNSWVVTVNHNLVDWGNLQWPSTLSVVQGNTTADIYAHTYEPGVTTGDNNESQIKVWIGVSPLNASANSNPSTWTTWILANFESRQNDNSNNLTHYQYKTSINSTTESLSVGTYRYATRFQKSGSSEFYYGGFNQGQWDGTNNVSGTLTVTQPIPVVTGASWTGTYNSAFSQTVSATNSPTLYSQESGTLPNGLTLNTSTGNISGTPSLVGTYNFTITATNSGGTSTPASFSITINKVNQTITFGALATKTYGDAPFNLTATASSGLAVTYTSSNASVATISGNTVTIVGAGSTTITSSQAGNANYNAATDVTQTLTVNQKALTITGLTANNKTYDGTTAATLSGTASLVGVVTTDLSNVTLGGTPVATFASSAIGSNIAVTVTGYSISGSASGNYTLSQPAGLTANITAPPAGYYRSKSSGNWATASTWEYSSDNTNWITAAAAPTSSDLGITILSGHTVTVGASATSKNLTVQSGGTLTVNSSFSISGTTNISGIWNQTTGTLTTKTGILNFLANSTYIHATNGGTILTANWDVASECKITGMATTQPAIASFGQTFGKFTWNCSSQSNFAVIGADGSFNPKGLFTVNSTGTSVIELESNGNGKDYYFDGGFYIDGGIFDGNYGTGSSVLETSIIVTGDFNIAGTGVVRLMDGTGTGTSGYGSSLYLNNNLNITSTASYPLTAKTSELGFVLFQGNTPQNFNSTNATNSRYVDYQVYSTSTLNLNSDLYLFSSSSTAYDLFYVYGTLNLNTYAIKQASGTSARFSSFSGSTIITSNTGGLVSGITVGGTKTWTAGTNYIFNASTTTPFPTAGTFGNPASLTFNNAMVTSNKTTGLSVTGNVNINGTSKFLLNSSGTNHLTLGGIMTIDSSATFDSNGENQIQGSTGSIIVNGTFITKDKDGFIGTATTVPSLSVTLNTGSTVEYGLLGDQIVQGTTAPTYQNITFSGSGIKSLASTNPIAGNILIKDNATFYQDGKTFGSSTTNVTMTDNAVYKIGGSGLKPDATGTYTLGANTTIEFSDSSATNIRAGVSNPEIPYTNVVVSGTNVSLDYVATPINIQTGGSFKVKSGATFKISHTVGFNGGTATAIATTNNPTITLLEGSTVEYAGADQTITHFAPNYAHLKISGTGVKTLLNATETKVGEDLILSASTLNIENDKALTVVNKINTTGGTLEVQNTGSLVQINDVQNELTSGTNKANKTTTTYRNYDYIYWSSPLDNETLGSVFAENPAGYKYAHNAAEYLDLYSGSYTQTSGTPDGYDDNGSEWVAASNTSVMSAGRGYIVLGKGSPIPFNSSQIAGTQPAQSVVFDGGKFNNGTIPVSVSIDKYHLDNLTGADAAHLNTNFIGNPYPSAIDIHKLKSENPLLTGTFYFWTHDLGVDNTGGPNAYDFYNTSYAAITTDGTNVTGQTNSSTNIAAPTTIASGQGFMANVSNDGTINFKNNMRITSGNTTFLRTANPNFDRLWLNLTTQNGLYRQIYVGFKDGFSDSYADGEDGPRMFSGAVTDFYSKMNGDTRNFAIQNLNSFNENKMVDLGLTIYQNDTYQISLDHTEGIFTQGQAIYLEDKYLNVIHDFANGAYSFTQNAGNDINNRFVLRFTNATASTPAEAFNNILVYPNPSKGVFNLAYYGSETLQYTLYDMTGKQIAKGVGNQIDLSNNAIGMYIAKITDGNAVRTVKLVRE